MYFARTGIRPIEVTYEGLLANPTGCIQTIAKALDVEYDGEIDISSSRFKMQRNNDSQLWRERFISEFGDPDSIDPFFENSNSSAGRNAKRRRII
jgi:LPS sulfotransferase NodH